MKPKLLLMGALLPTLPFFFFLSPANAAPSAADSGAVIKEGTVAEKVLGGFGQTDGPAFSRLGYLVFSDAPKNTILKYVPTASKDVFEGGSSGSKPMVTILRNNSRGATGLTFDRQGRLIVCETSARRVTRTEKDGSISVLADRVNGRRLNGPRDAVHAIDGSTYFTDPAPHGTGAVCQIMRDGSVRTVLDAIDRPAGIALSANQRFLYLTDGATNQIRVYAVIGDGALVDGRTFATLDSSANGSAGGIKTDQSGNVYCAGPGGVWAFDEHGGHLGTITVPEAPASVGWGDDFKTLYVTAGTSLYKIRLSASGTRTF